MSFCTVTLLIAMTHLRIYAFFHGFSSLIESVHPFYDGQILLLMSSRPEPSTWRDLFFLVVAGGSGANPSCLGLSRASTMDEFPIPTHS